MLMLLCLGCPLQKKGGCEVLEKSGKYVKGTRIFPLRDCEVEDFESGIIYSFNVSLSSLFNEIK